jgi:Flp pilus assembly protein TadB
MIPKQKHASTDNSNGLFQSLCRTAYNSLKSFGDKNIRFWEDKNLRKSIDLLELGIKPIEVHALSFLATAVTFILVIIVIVASLLSGSQFTAALLFFFIFPFVLYYYVEKYPIMLLESKKTEMIGYLPEIASYLVISLRVSPILEKAVEFTAEHTTGFPRKLLKRMIADIHMGKSTSIVESMSAFSEEWGDIPEFKAFIQLIIASSLESSEKGRWMMLDNGMNVLLSGLRERTDKAVRSLETPILVVFTFLVILPLVFIGLVPALPTVGLDLPPMLIFLLYDIILPAVLYISINFITTSKPVTIPPIELPQKEYEKIFGALPTKNINRRNFILGIIVLCTIIALPGIIDLINAVNGINPAYPLGTSMIVISIGLGCGLYLLGTSISVKKTRDSIRQEEDEFAETLRQLAVLLSSGRPLPNAMAHITDLNKGSSAQIFSKAANNIRLFNIGMRESFFGEKEGSASKTYSRITHSSVDTIISISNRSGKDIASVIIRLSEHLRNMRSVDNEMKKVITSVTSSMIIISVFVGPLVGGVATGLGYLIAKTLANTGTGGLVMEGMAIKTINPEIVKLIIGIYVLETTAILTVFSDELIHGSDKTIKKYHLGMYLPIAAFVFAVTVLLVQVVFGPMI